MVIVYLNVKIHLMYLKNVYFNCGGDRGKHLCCFYSPGVTGSDIITF